MTYLIKGSERLTISGVVLRELRLYADERGWLTELVREDELPLALHPSMGYLSMTRPNVTRGPHEHHEQTDYFVFLPVTEFLVTLKDNREPGHHELQLVLPRGAGDAACVLIVPPGVIHSYMNIGENVGWVLNFPNRCYRGPGKRSPPDEIRYEDQKPDPLV